MGKYEIFEIFRLLGVTTCHRVYLYIFDRIKKNGCGNIWRENMVE
jgi:hypothetical protein